MCENEEAVRRFVVEAQAVNRIESPHIVKTFDFVKWLLGRTEKFPKSPRFFLAKRLNQELIDSTADFDCK